MCGLRDRRGRVWARRLDVAAAVRMREIAGLDVMALAIEGGDLEDLPAVVNALYAVMLPDIGRLTPWRFGRRLRAMAADELRRELIEAIGEFFAMPGPERSREGNGRDVTPAELWRDVWRMAGGVGVDPGPHTFGELALMAEGQRRRDWPLNAALRATIVNCNPYGDGVAVDPADLDPTGMLREAGGRGTGSSDLTADNLGQFATLLMGR